MDGRWAGEGWEGAREGTWKCEGSGVELYKYKLSIILAISIKNTMGNKAHKSMTMGDSFSGLDVGAGPGSQFHFSGIDMVSLTGLFDVQGDAVRP